MWTLVLFIYCDLFLVFFCLYLDSIVGERTGSKVGGGQQGRKRFANQDSNSGSPMRNRSIVCRIAAHEAIGSDIGLFFLTLLLKKEFHDTFIYSSGEL